MFEWIIAGVALLAAAAIMQKLVEQGSLQAFIAAFICLWSALAAVYFWGPGTWLARHLVVLFEGRQAVLVGYWLAFLISALPHMALFRFWIRNYRTTFPPLFDYALTWLSALAVGAAVFCLLIMSMAVAANGPREFNGKKLKFRADLAPMQAYLWLARHLPQPPPGEAPAAVRIPREARELFVR